MSSNRQTIPPSVADGNNNNIVISRNSNSSFVPEPSIPTATATSAAVLDLQTSRRPPSAAATLQCQPSASMRSCATQTTNVSRLRMALPSSQIMPGHHYPAPRLPSMASRVSQTVQQGFRASNPNAAYFSVRHTTTSKTSLASMTPRFPNNRPAHSNYLINSASSQSSYNGALKKPMPTSHYSPRSNGSKCNPSIRKPENARSLQPAFNQTGTAKKVNFASIEELAKSESNDDGSTCEVPPQILTKQPNNGVPLRAVNSALKHLNVNSAGNSAFSRPTTSTATKATTEAKKALIARKQSSPPPQLTTTIVKFESDSDDSDEVEIIEALPTSLKFLSLKPTSGKLTPRPSPASAKSLKLSAKNGSQIDLTKGDNDDDDDDDDDIIFVEEVPNSHPSLLASKLNLAIKMKTDLDSLSSSETLPKASSIVVAAPVDTSIASTNLSCPATLASPAQSVQPSPGHTPENQKASKSHSSGQISSTSSLSDSPKTASRPLSNSLNTPGNIAVTCNIPSKQCKALQNREPPSSSPAQESAITESNAAKSQSKAASGPVNKQGTSQQSLASDNMFRKPDVTPPTKNGFNSTRVFPSTSATPSQMISASQTKSAVTSPTKASATASVTEVLKNMHNYKIPKLNTSSSSDSPSSASTKTLEPKATKSSSASSGRATDSPHYQSSTIASRERSSPSSSSILSSLSISTNACQQSSSRYSGMSPSPLSPQSITSSPASTSNTSNTQLRKKGSSSGTGNTSSSSNLPPKPSPLPPYSRSHPHSKTTEPKMTLFSFSSSGRAPTTIANHQPSSSMMASHRRSSTMSSASSLSSLSPTADRPLSSLSSLSARSAELSPSPPLSSPPTAPKASRSTKPSTSNAQRQSTSSTSQEVFSGNQNRLPGTTSETPNAPETSPPSRIFLLNGTFWQTTLNNSPYPDTLYPPPPNPPPSTTESPADCTSQSPNVKKSNIYYSKGSELSGGSSNLHPARHSSPSEASEASSKSKQVTGGSFLVPNTQPQSSSSSVQQPEILNHLIRFPSTPEPKTTSGGKVPTTTSQSPVLKTQSLQSNADRRPLTTSTSQVGQSSHLSHSLETLPQSASSSLTLSSSSNLAKPVSPKKNDRQQSGNKLPSFKNAASSAGAHHAQAQSSPPKSAAIASRFDADKNSSGYSSCENPSTSRVKKVGSSASFPSSSVPATKAAANPKTSVNPSTSSTIRSQPAKKPTFAKFTPTKPVKDTRSMMASKYNLAFYSPGTSKPNKAESSPSSRPSSLQRRSLPPSPPSADSNGQQNAKEKDNSSRNILKAKRALFENTLPLSTSAVVLQDHQNLPSRPHSEPVANQTNQIRPITPDHAPAKLSKLPISPGRIIFRSPYDKGFTPSPSQGGKLPVGFRRNDQGQLERISHLLTYDNFEPQPSHSRHFTGELDLTLPNRAFTDSVNPNEADNRPEEINAARDELELGSLTKNPNEEARKQSEKSLSLLLKKTPLQRWHIKKIKRWTMKALKKKKSSRKAKAKHKDGKTGKSSGNHSNSGSENLRTSGRICSKPDFYCAPVPPSSLPTSEKTLPPAIPIPERFQIGNDKTEKPLQSSEIFYKRKPRLGPKRRNESASWRKMAPSVKRLKVDKKANQSSKMIPSSSSFLSSPSSLSSFISPPNFAHDRPECSSCHKECGNQKCVFINANMEGAIKELLKYNRSILQKYNTAREAQKKTARRESGKRLQPTTVKEPQFHKIFFQDMWLFACRHCYEWLDQYLTKAILEMEAKESTIPSSDTKPSTSFSKHHLLPPKPPANQNQSKLPPSRLKQPFTKALRVHAKRLEKSEVRHLKEVYGWSEKAKAKGESRYSGDSSLIAEGAATSANELHDRFCWTCHKAIRLSKDHSPRAVTCPTCHLAWHPGCSAQARSILPFRVNPASQSAVYEDFYHLNPIDQDDNICWECQNLSYAYQYDSIFGQRSTGYNVQMLRNMFFYALNSFGLNNCKQAHDSRHCFFKVDLSEEDNDKITHDNVQEKPPGSSELHYWTRRSKIYRPMDLSIMMHKAFSLEKKFLNKFYGTTKQLLFDINLMLHNIEVAYPWNTAWAQRMRFMKPIFLNEIKAIDRCGSCYLKYYETPKGEDSFNVTCDTPHALVWYWDRARGVYWPAKALEYLVPGSFALDYDHFVVMLFGTNHPTHTNPLVVHKKYLLQYSRIEPTEAPSGESHWSERQLAPTVLKKLIEQLDQSRACVKAYLASRAKDFVFPEVPELWAPFHHHKLYASTYLPIKLADKAMAEAEAKRAAKTAAARAAKEARRLQRAKERAAIGAAEVAFNVRIAARPPNEPTNFEVINIDSD